MQKCECECESKEKFEINVNEKQLEDNQQILKLKQEINGHQSKVWCVCWHPNGRILTSCGKDKIIKLWKVSNEKELTNDNISLNIFMKLEGDQSKTIRRVSWSPNGVFLASASFDSTICIYAQDHSLYGDHSNQSYDVIAEEELQLVSKLEGHESEVKGVSWDDSSRFLSSCSRDKSVWVWEYEVNHEEVGEVDFSTSCVLTEHTQDVKNVIWKPNTATLFTCSYDNSIKIWESDDDDWVLQQSLESHYDTVWDISITNDGAYMGSVCNSGEIKIWQLQEVSPPALEVQALKGYHTRSAYSCHFNSDGSLLVTCGGDNRINLFKQEQPDDYDPMCQQKYLFISQLKQAHQMEINCVRFHPSLNIVASCGDDGQIKIWIVDI